MRAHPYLRCVGLLGLLSLICLSFRTAHAGSATWNLNPVSGDWNDPANWTPTTVPNGPSDVATFAASNAPGVTLSAASTEVAEIVFNPGASAFNITVPAPTQGSAVLTVSGVGLVNNSSATQNFTLGSATSGGVGTLDFENTATAGTNTVYMAWGAHGNGASPSVGTFHQNSTAGSATFIAQGATKGLDVDGGGFGFVDNSTAGNANFTINGAYTAGGSGGGVGFNDFSTAGNATFVLNPGTTGDLAAGTMDFRENATAGNGVFTLNGATACCTETEIDFTDAASAGDGFFTVMGGQQSNGLGGMLYFNGFTFTGLITTAGNATIINEGGIAAGARGGLTTLSTSSTAGQALIIANGGENGGGPGSIDFFNDSDGGQAQIQVYDNGYLDISFHLIPGVTIGSLAGDGFVFLGSNNLTVGSNNLSSTFSGTLQENGGIVNGRNGSLTKIGTATLTLSGASSYTGGTTVSGGTLRVKNTSGSATGTKAVLVNAGALSGSGIIAGAVTLGTGSGTGAFLAPAPGPKKQTTLTIQSALTFNADATYTYTFRARGGKARSDKVIANGVTINSGAFFAFQGTAQGTLNPGLSFTAISNTGASPIAGTFSNLPDGAILTVNGNNFQADYEGGDGNDLTLTVVP